VPSNPRDGDDFPVPPLGDEPKVGPSGKTAEQLKAERSARMRAINEARRGKGSGKTKAKTTSTAAPSGDLQAVKVSVAEGLAKTGALILPAVPLPGGYLIANADAAANVAARLAARHPALLASMSKASDYADYITAGSLVFGFGVSVAVQLGRMPVDHPLAVNLGVTAVYDDLLEQGVFEQPEEGAHVAGGNPDERDVPVPDILAATPAAS
jgi:hypothetical protein